MEKSCVNPDCTVAQTGKCLLNNALEVCVNLHGQESDALAMSGLPPVLAAPTSNIRVAPSLTLDLDSVERLASKRPCTQIGILGLPASGKTAALVSLYLLVAKGRLIGFEFRNSLSLMALEKISRGARRWDATSLPDQLTTHTEIADNRTAGYLHFRLHATRHGFDFDILLPDLPGEWTKSLIDSNRTDRLEFLKAASAIWLFVDGRKLQDVSTRQHSLHRCELVLRRLKNFLKEGSPAITLVVTHKDRGPIVDDIFSSVIVLADELGLNFGVHQIASFAHEESTTAAGEGIAELIDSLFLAPNLQSWFDAGSRQTSQRSVGGFRGRAL
jgi:hypothetical protein